jgi:hypothetical protein
MEPLTSDDAATLPDQMSTEAAAAMRGEEIAAAVRTAPEPLRGRSRC